ncbi:MAG: SagB/ThcOx family dehydrogenase [Pseudomonadota bacterium]|nr:SagB/ThcOx family dehydrogenase [Pseudomonadota bacterium]
MSRSLLRIILDYHDRTKHRLDGYAQGPDTLDWDAQPDPFRRYDEASLIDLPLLADQQTLPYRALSEAATIAAHALTLPSVAVLLETSVALSAWKHYGTARWSLRVNPSSGNLHPTETYVVAVGVEGLRDGVYHYRADLHALEPRCRFDAGSNAEPALHIGFSSVHWREAWKYGERAFRYCQHDVGHAMAAISYGAAALGWTVGTDLHWGDAALATLLGLDREADFQQVEQEHPDVLLRVHTTQAYSTQPSEARELLAWAQGGHWQGKANRLDPKPLYHWPVIDEVAAASERPVPTDMQTDTQIPPDMAESVPVLASACTRSAAELLRRRRSAQAFDGTTWLPLDAFLRMLDQLVARPRFAPWNALPWAPRLHLVLFIHRVEGLAPGLYALPRSEHGLALMRDQMRAEFQWQAVSAAPDTVPLYQLLLARAERTIAKLSCQQAIAGDSCFSVAMLAEFEPVLAAGPWRYRELFWEAGSLGQCLYLEAEAAGVRGTGIGCYFDDPVHELLGLTDHTLQNLYHFTVGGPLVDHRITTLPPYPAKRR